MAGGLLMALGGAMKGYGDATLDELKEAAKAKREEALADAQFERQRALAADTRQFQSDETQKQRDFSMGENEKSRAESAKNRESDEAFRRDTLEIQRRTADRADRDSGDLIQTQDGPMVRRGTTAEPVVGKDGKPVKIMSPSKDNPADVVTMEYLITKGVAKDYDDAWTKVKQGVNPQAEPADVERMVETATKTELDGKFGVSKEEIQKTREENRARIMKNLGMDKQQGQSSGPSSGDTDKDAFIKQSIDNARAAISAGKPRDKVIERLKAAGIDTTGL